MNPTVPDGPDTELAAAIANLRRGTEIRLAALKEGRVSVGTGRRLVTIVRAMLARPDGAPQHLVQGDRVETADGVRATVTGPAPRGPHGEPAVNLDWDGDAGGPAYEHDLRRVVDARPAAGRDLTAQDVRDALASHGALVPPRWVGDQVAEHLTRIARPAVARTDGQPPADELLFRVDEPRVAGRGPSCGRESLRATAGGHVVCTRLECPSPTAADDLLHGGLPQGLVPADDTAAPDQRHPQTVRSLAHAEAMFFRDHARRGYALLRGMARRSSELRRAGQPVRDSQPEATDG